MAFSPTHTAQRTSGLTYFIAAVAAISGLLFGFDIAVINGALIFIRQQFRLSNLQTELTASALLLGCIAGAMLGGWLSDHFGRRRTLRWVAVLFALSSAGAALAHSMIQFDAARIIGGVAIGIASMLAPLYIAETAPARIRGRLVSFNQLSIVIGILMAYGINWALSFASGSGWRWMFATAALPSGLLFIGLSFVPESPRWLFEKNRFEEARNVLLRVEASDGVDTILSNLKAAALTEPATFRELLQRNMRVPLVLTVGLAILQQITGINTVFFYGSLIFEQTIFPHRASAALAANITLGVVNLIATIASLLIIDSIGRKPLIIGSSFALGIGELALAVGFLHPEKSAILILISMLVCVGAFAIGLGPGTWILLTEVFPTRIRGRAMSVANVNLWAASLLLTVTFLTLAQHVTLSGAFCIYAAFCGITAVFIYRLAPETSGLSLEEIEALWTTPGAGGHSR